MAKWKRNGRFGIMRFKGLEKLEKGVDEQ